MMQESIQNIRTPWELIVAMIVGMAFGLFYLVKKMNQNRKEDIERIEKESKYHRERADRVDEEAKKDRIEFQKERTESHKTLNNNQNIIEKMAETMHSMGGELKNKMEELLREVRK